MKLQLDRIDHIHVFVADRTAAQRWYAEVLGLIPVAALAHWAKDGGPLTLANADGAIHLALFERPPKASRSTVAFGVNQQVWQAWRQHLDQLALSYTAEDHGQTVSIYFDDPDGNPYEITCPAPLSRA